MVALRGIVPGALFRSPQSGVRISKSSSLQNVKQDENNNQPSKPSGSKGIGQVILLAVLGLLGVNAGRDYVADSDRKEEITFLANVASDLSLENKTLQEQVGKLNADLSSRITLDQIKNVIKQVTPSTVSINGAVSPYGDAHIGGSGVIMISPDGKRYILSAGHILESVESQPMAMTPFGPMPMPGPAPDNSIETTFHIKLYSGSDFQDGIAFDAKPVKLPDGKKAHSPHNEFDLLLLEIPEDVQLPDGAGVHCRDIKKEPVEAGEPLITVGNPFGMGNSVGFGITSHAERKHPFLIVPNAGPSEEVSKGAHIQTDATAGPGNSGGGLFDLKGRLVGIISWGDPAANFGGAMRVDEVLKVLEGWGIKVN